MVGLDSMPDTLEPSIKENRWSKEFEKPIYEEWKNSQRYRFNKESKKKIYSIDTPPPYVNTPVHMGHATTYALMDMFARYRRMKGYEVLFPLGLDRNGLPIEMAAEKKFNVRAHTLRREEFLELCKKILEASSTASTETFLHCGISFNSWKIGTDIGDLYHTDSPEYRTLTQATFIDLWNKKLIYEDTRINNWCPGCRTTLADSEVVRTDVETSLNYVKFPIKSTQETVIIATTRPELLCTAAIIIYHPKDSRYKHLKGKTAITPIFNLEVPIIEHTSADLAFGTGLVFMSRSAGDQDAIRFLREMNITPKMAVGIDGRMNENAGLLQGLKTKDARQKIIDQLHQQGFLEKQEKIMHSVPICERSKDQIEFIAMPELYVKQVEFKKNILKLQKKLHFHDESSRQILIDWIHSISIDWPISRRRYYATEIPLWYCKKCHEPYVPPHGKYYQPWKEKPPISQCPACKHPEFIAEERVFDTWFDSSITPLAILQYTRNPEFFSHATPCTLRPQGKEIIRTWLYYTLLKCYLLTNTCIFQDVWINYHVLDDTGKKMSKSLGNIIDPQEIITRFGAEPFRFWAVVEGNLSTGDFRCSFDRIDGAGKTLVKLWNIARFISLFPTQSIKKPELTPLDVWILHELSELVTLANTNYQRYDFHTPAVALRHFIWETFASHYLELVKPRAYNHDNTFTQEENTSALWTLHHCLKILLQLLAPILPFITYKLYKDLYHQDIHFETFPKQTKQSPLNVTTQDITAFNRFVWNYKKTNNKSLNTEINSATLSEQLKPLSRDLLAAHKIKHADYTKTSEIHVQL